MKEITELQIDHFLHLLSRRQVEIHSICIYQNGALLLNQSYEPYNAAALHPLYSVTKSFTSVAIGYLATEGLVDLNESWISYFPEYRSDVTDDRFFSVTIRDLLTMTMGQDSEAIVAGDDDWIRNIVSKPLAYEPSAVFFYNSMCSMLLSALIQKITGMKESEYINQKLFAPLEIRDWRWEEDRQGHSIGGLGLHLKIDDLLKFGICLLNDGMFKGSQVIPGIWVKQATSKQVETEPYISAERTENTQGYGFHFWRCSHNGYRCSGMHGQLCMVLPEEKTVLAVNSATISSKSILDCFFESTDCADMEKENGEYHISLPQGNSRSKYQNLLVGKFTSLQKDSISFNLSEEKIVMSGVLNGRSWSVQAKYLSWYKQQDCFTGIRPFYMQDAMKETDETYTLYACYAWKTDTALEISIRTLDQTAADKIVIHLDRNYILAERTTSAFMCVEPHTAHIYKRG